MTRDFAPNTPSTPVVLDVSKEEADLICQIAARAHAMNPEREKRAYMADIDATHRCGCALRLADLLAADDLNFSHDIGGIVRHLDRKTGKLGGNFLPRFALVAAAPPRTVFFSPDAMTNQSVAVVFTEEEWEALQGPLFDVWSGLLAQQESMAEAPPPSPSMPN